MAVPMAMQKLTEVLVHNKVVRNEKTNSAVLLLIKHLKGSDSSIKRLSELGIHVGATIELIRSSHLHGPVHVKVHGAEFAIGRTVAEKIFVQAR